MTRPAFAESIPRRNVMPSAPIANLINALALCLLPIWAYWESPEPSLTAFIPLGFGVALLLCQPGVKAQNKVIAHIAVLLTLVVFVALFMPLSSRLDGSDPLGLSRVVAMMLTSLVAMIAFIGSFRAARKAHEANDDT
ncbi:MAG: hypothetical protein AAFR32_04675 [Pseudomonadota bacterium]